MPVNVLSCPGILAKLLAQLGWGLWFPPAITQPGGWGQEWAGASEMLALTHEAHVAILAFWEVAPPLIPATADICLVAAGWRPDCWRQGRLAGRPG